MTAWVYTVARNESLMMPYLLRHYATFCDRMVVYDDKSDDGTPDHARAGGAEVRPYPFEGLDDIEFVGLANAVYIEARGQADWIIWVDADEFLYHPRGMLQRLLELKEAGITLPKVQGYGMIADAPPTTRYQIYDEINVGFEHHRYSKPCILNPILGIRWEVGKHDIKVFGNGATTNTDDPLRLLHYRYLGREYHEARNAKNWERISKQNIAYRLGYETAPGWQGEYSANWHEQQRHRADICV
jgi:glycosyltransferase involved in cell wall biosynthesis